MLILLLLLLDLLPGLITLFVAVLDYLLGDVRAIVRNVCLSRLRERRDGIPFIELPESFGPKEPRESSAEEYIDRLALREWVWTALSHLPETLRVTAMVRYFGSYSSYEEISVILGVPVGTVKSRLN